MLKIILAGAAGRMGEQITHLVSAPDSIVYGIDLRKGSGNYPYGVLPDSNDIGGNVIVDFSSPVLLPDILMWGKKNHLPIVIAQTKLSSELIDLIKETSLEVPIVIAPNLAINVIKFKKLLKKAVELFPEFDIEIIERHHREKLDAPSGTALALFETIKEVRTESVLQLDRHNSGKRSKEEVGIVAIRGGNIVGEHDVILASNNEVIELKHQAITREIFADGAIQVSRLALKLEPGLYKVEDLL